MITQHFKKAVGTSLSEGSGALKSLNYGNGRRLTMGYNANRNQPISMKVDRVSNASDKVIASVVSH
ncbi:MAG: hypothetical protein JNJ50_26925 [Acidobacteria bacterium]|nr:hypothetical protein [Acidobacteriota bacterium]